MEPLDLPDRRRSTERRPRQVVPPERAFVAERRVGRHEDGQGNVETRGDRPRGVEGVRVPVVERDRNRSVLDRPVGVRRDQLRSVDHARHGREVLQLPAERVGTYRLIERIGVGLGHSVVCEDEGARSKTAAEPAAGEPRAHVARVRHDARTARTATSIGKRGSRWSSSLGRSSSAASPVRKAIPVRTFPKVTTSTLLGPNTSPKSRRAEAPVSRQ